MSMAANLSPSCTHLLRLRHRVPHPLPPLSSSSYLFFWPISASASRPPPPPAAAAFSATTAVLPVSPELAHPSPASNAVFATASAQSASFSFGHPPAVFRRLISSGAFHQTSSSLVENDQVLDFDEDDDDDDDYNEEIDEEDENGDDVEPVIAAEVEEAPEQQQDDAFLPPIGNKRIGLKLNLSVKEKKELSSYAHSLGKKLKCQLVGKSGVTDNVAASFVETLEANELLKIKIHRTCPGELDEVVERLEALTGSVVVGQIGRTVIIYRPSLAKLKAEEKKKQAQRIFMRKRLKPRPEFMKSGPGASRTNARPRRRSSSRV